MESKNLSIMVTDILGFSQKSAASTRSDLINFVKTHSKLLVPVIDFYKGKIIKSMGDSFLCVFESATDAAVCAVAIETIVFEFNRKSKSSGLQMTIRIVINSGDVSLEKGDIFGDPVNLVSRMEKMDELAQGGIAISESTYLLMNRQEVVVESLGFHQFKGIAHPVQVYRLPIDKQKLSALPTRLLEMVERVADGTERTSVIQLDQIMGKQTAPKKVEKESIGKTIKYGFALCVLVLLGIIAFKLMSPSSNLGSKNQETPLLSWLKASDKKRTGIILKEQWVGPPEVFIKIDSNADQRINPDEIIKYASSEGIDLPPPPQAPHSEPSHSVE